MDHSTADNELIIKYVKELKLPAVKDRLEDTVAQALAGGWDHRRFLAALLQKEVAQRYENRKYTRIHRASFPQMKYLAELVREDLPADGRNLLPEFETLNFIREGRNIVMPMMMRVTVIFIRFAAPLPPAGGSISSRGKDTLSSWA